MAIEGGVFTNLKLNGMVIRSLPLFVIRKSSQRRALNCHKVRVKPYNMLKHIKNGKTFRLYAEAYRNL
jgi:hypothetical protein